MDCGLPGSSFHVIFQKSSGVGCYCLLHYKKVKKKEYQKVDVYACLNLKSGVDKSFISRPTVHGVAESDRTK